MIKLSLKEVLLKRRSIRKFTSDLIGDDLINELLHAAMSGPSACNMRPWEFFVITNRSVLLELKNASRFTKMDSPLAIIVCGNLKNCLPKDMAQYWIQDCSAATENILLQATDLGLGAVWCGIYPQTKAVDNVQNILQLSENLIPLNIIFIGYPDEEKDARDQYDENKIHYIR